MVLKVFAVDDGEGALEQKNTEYKNALAKYIESLCAASGDKDCKTTYEKEIEPCVKEARTKIQEKESKGEKAAADGSDERDFLQIAILGKRNCQKKTFLEFLLVKKALRKKVLRKKALLVRNGVIRKKNVRWQLELVGLSVPLLTFSPPSTTSPINSYPPHFLRRIKILYSQTT